MPITVFSADRFSRRPVLRGRAAAVALVVLLAGCSGGAGGADPAPTSAASTVAPASAPVVTAAPAEQALDPLLVGTVPVDNPDGLVAVGDALFVKTDDGRVVRIDPKTVKVTGEVKLDTATDRNNYCQGITTDGTAVWACSASDSSTGLVKVDPTTLTAGAVVPVGKIFTQLSLPRTARGVWVLTGTGRTLSVVDPAGEVTSYELGSECGQVAASEQVVAVTCARDGLVLLIDPATGSVTGRVSVQDPGIAAVVDRTVVVDTKQGVAQIGPGATVDVVYSQVLSGGDGDVVAAGAVVWVRGSGGRLWRLDPATKAITATLKPATPLSAGSLHVTADAVWASDNNNGTVLKFSLPKT